MAPSRGPVTSVWNRKAPRSNLKTSAYATCRKRIEDRGSRIEDRAVVCNAILDLRPSILDPHEWLLAGFINSANPYFFPTVYVFTLDCAVLPPDAGNAVQSEVVRRRI